MGKNEGGGSDDERKERYDDRDSLVSWFSAEEECPWLHERLKALIGQVGNAVWPILEVDSEGQPKCEYEATQYAVYGPKQHFQAWHQDAFEEGNDPEDARQFTIVVMVSESRAYTGGRFQAKLPVPGSKRKLIRNLQMEAGDCLVFPAKRLMRRVSAVNSGTRKTLVFWAFDRASCNYHTLGEGTVDVPAGTPILG